MNEKLLNRLRSFSEFTGKESLDGSYAMAQACIEAANEIERLENEQDDLVLIGPDGTEFCRFSGDEATEIISEAVILLVSQAIRRVVE